jgi:uncharacterized RDD family membrane protein YckC
MSFQVPPAAPPAGSAAMVYADLPNRIFAFIIDIVVLAVINIVLAIVLGIVGLSILSGLQVNYFAVLVYGVVGLLISAGYFIYTWTSMRATFGMKALGMQIGNEGDGATLTMNQAARRWIAVGGWISIAQIVNPVPLIGSLVGLAGLVYIIFLLYTTAQSPTKQGYHDHFAHTMVVKATRAVA